MSKAKVEMKPLPKRFYAAASYAPSGDGFSILLDGKQVRTPQQKLLQCSSQQLAQQIVAEWDAQVEVINTDTMPLTRLLNIALDRVAIDRAALLAEISKYGGTDLLFYRTPVQQNTLIVDRAAEELAVLQHQHFSPILVWLEESYGVRFNLTEGLMPIDQPEASAVMLAELFAAATDHELAALAMMVPLLGSALLVLAVWKGAVDVEAALVAARLDETVQQNRWGADKEVAANWQAKCRDVRASAFFLTCN